MALKYNIKRLEQQKAKVLEAQATIDCKIKEAEECKCKAEAEKAMKKAKKEEEKKVRLLLKQQEKVEKKLKGWGSIKQVFLSSIPEGNDAVGSGVHHQDEGGQRFSDV